MNLAIPLDATPIESFSKRALPLAGGVFGELTALSPIAKDHLGYWWQCQCTCGKVVLRRTAWLRSELRNGRTPACRECKEETRQGAIVARQADPERWMAQWIKHHTLYGALTMERMTEHLRQALEQADIGYAREQPMPEKPWTSYGFEEAKTFDKSRNRQRLAYLYPLSEEEDRGWNCVDCKAWFTRGFGCIACVDPVCGDCLRKEKHDCKDYPNVGAHSEEMDELGATYGEIGADLGVSRERVRQIILETLRKIWQDCNRFDHIGYEGELLLHRWGAPTSPFGRVAGVFHRVTAQTFGRVLLGCGRRIVYSDVTLLDHDDGSNLRCSCACDDFDPAEPTELRTRAPQGPRSRRKSVAARKPPEPQTPTRRELEREREKAHAAEVCKERIRKLGQACRAGWIAAEGVEHFVSEEHAAIGQVFALGSVQIFAVPGSEASLFRAGQWHGSAFEGNRRYVTHDFATKVDAQRFIEMSCGKGWIP